MEIIKIVISEIFIVMGIIVLVSGVVGIFRIKYVLNRLHSAAMVDSLGLLLITIGIIIYNGFSFDSVKLFLIVLLFWIAAPVCSHLVAALEVSTNPEIDKDCEIMDEKAYENLKLSKKDSNS